MRGGKRCMCWALGGDDVRYHHGSFIVDKWKWKMELFDWG